MCLAMAIYFEARGEPMVGKVAVAQVVMHRVYDHRFPNKVCDVVKEGYYYSWDKNIPIRDKCQFSFWCDGKPEIVNDMVAWGFAVYLNFFKVFECGFSGRIIAHGHKRHGNLIKVAHPYRFVTSRACFSRYGFAPRVR